MSKIDASRACPACAADVPAGRLTCSHCGFNLAYAEQVGVEAALEEMRNPRPRPSREGLREAVLAAGRPLLAPLGVVALFTAVVVAAVVVIPVGPNIKAEEIEAGIVEAMQGEAPPSATSTPTEVDCVHPLTNTRTFDCRGKQDIALLPDAEFRYRVSAYDDGGRVCWTGRLAGNGRASSALLPDRVGGCS